MSKTIALPQLPKPARRPGRWVWAMRGVRLALLAVIVALLMFQADRHTAWRADDPVRLDEAAALFPDAARVAPSDTLAGGFDVTDVDGQPLGQLVRTMPAAEGVVGYRGPTDTLLALDLDGTIVGMRLRRSADTPDHLRDVAEDREFMANFTGWRLHDLADYDNARALEDADVWPVSGATLTSSAVIDGVVARAKAQEQLEATPPAVRLGWQDAAIAVWIVGGLALMFTRLRKAQHFRAAFRAGVVVWHLGFGGGLLALSLLTGWAMHGPAWRTAPALAALVALMFVLPMLLGKNAYCQELCPHGILQGWLRRVPFIKPVAFSKPGRDGLRWLAPALLAAALVGVLLDLPMDLANFEPFDTYPLWRSGGWAWGGTVFVFIVGLLLSVRYPMAYCQYACPTGWLLRAAAGRRGARRVAASDVALAGVLLITAGIVALGHRAWAFAHPMENAPTLLTPLQQDGQAPAPGAARPGNPPAPTLLVLEGTTMRTTWRVVVHTDRAKPIDPLAMGRRIADHLARIESAGSVWSAGSDPDKLNRAAPGRWVTLNPETRALFDAAENIQRQSGGTFNPTLGRNIRAIGLGPPAETTADAPNTAAEPTGTTAWELDRTNHRARRLHADAVFDLGGLLQGHAADRVAQGLIDAGVPGVLVEVGGEVRALGTPPPGGWRVVVEDDRGRPVGRALPPGRAVATSDSYTTARDGRGHIIDPATGVSQPARCRVTVFADDAATADAWATALVAAGPERAHRLIAEYALDADIVHP